MKLLSQQYQQMRYELGRIPMLMDFARRDASLVFTMASKNDDYLSFVRSREKSLSRGKNATVSYLEQLESTSDAHNGVLKNVDRHAIARLASARIVGFGGIVRYGLAADRSGLFRGCADCAS